MSLPFSRDQVAAIIKEQGADNLTAKRVRELLEESLGKESGDFKQHKNEIKEMIDSVMAEVCESRPAPGHRCGDEPHASMPRRA